MIKSQKSEKKSSRKFKQRLPKQYLTQKMREKGKIMIFFRDFPKNWEIYLKLKKNEKEKKKRLKRFAKIKKKYY